MNPHQVRFVCPNTVYPPRVVPISACTASENDASDAGLHRTLAAMKAAPFFRRQHESQFISQVALLLAHGYPNLAIVATFPD